MRLIDTKTLALKEFLGIRLPPYAILSHTWEGEEEVSFQDWADHSINSSTWKKKGCKKIIDTCQLAKNHGYDYLWVDTNCIDKSSSSELMEAINSMFKWYQFAQVCYVYLSDVPFSKGRQLSGLLRQSRWFQRGWTLQELLAPQDVQFYSNDWSLLGTKGSLRSEISSITGINIDYLWRKHVGDPYVGNSERNFIAQSIMHATPVRNASVGERLSWISNRTTTRVEDMAYCMLGIFDLNMPLLYGEGDKAFTRLQEEIMKVSDDHSLFCWTWNTPHHRGGFLSEVPLEFVQANRFAAKRENKRPAPYTLTNAGLSIRLPVLLGYESSFIGILNIESSTKDKIFGLPMSGDLINGRVCRLPFPPEPIPLCDQISRSQEFSLFITENYSQQHGHEPLMQPAPPTICNRTFDLLLTVGSQLMVRGIETYPPDRFDPVQSTISIYSDEQSLVWEQRNGWQRGIRFISRSNIRSTYEAVLIQLELQTGGFESFMVASTCELFSTDEEEQKYEEGHWTWHYWRVLQEEVSEILMGNLKEDYPGVDEIHEAIIHPSYAKFLDTRVSTTQPPRVSISMCKDYWCSGGRAICHMHIAEFESSKPAKGEEP